MSVKLNNNRGVTLIEMLMVLAIMGLLMHMVMISYFDYRQKAFNTRALSDGRNLATVISNSLVDKEDVDYSYAPGDGGKIGSADNEGNPRRSLFGLSQGVEARIQGSSHHYAGGQGFMEAFIFHENGSRDINTVSNKREYLCFIDELAGVIIFSID